MSKKKPRLYLIQNAAEMDAGFSPVRNQIRLVMEMLGDCDIHEIARQLGRSPESLYYHVQKMEAAGLVHRVERESVTGRDGAVYTLRARRIRIDTSVCERRFQAAFVRTARTLFRFAERCYLRAIGNSETVIKGEFRELRQIQMTTRLSRQNIVELNRRLLDLESFLEQADDPALNRRYVVMLALCPTGKTLDSDG